MDPCLPSLGCEPAILPLAFWQQHLVDGVNHAI